MINFLNKIFKKSTNSNYIKLAFQKLNQETEVKKIFEAIEEYSEASEIRYVGGCVRKIINKEIVDDIDLATNIRPKEVLEALNKNKIKFYESGIEHGTITAIINKNKFEITSLRKDIETDGRHAKIQFSDKWHDDASRRDFSINAIYADFEGNLYDPFNGKKNLENGIVNFIGEEEKRIKEDYLRILRYVRFFLNYSRKDHNQNIIKIIKRNLDGISKISSERLLDEFKKLTKSQGFINLIKDKFCLEIINLIFPQFKNISILKNVTKKNISNVDFILLISLMIIDGTDNAEYFIYKFNISKKDKKRILFLNNFFLKKNNSKSFSIQNLQKILYFNGKETLLDLLNFQIFRSKKIDKKLIEMKEYFKEKEPPILPLRATTLMTKYNIQEGKNLGIKLKQLEEKWVDNNFKISEEQVEKILKN